MLQSFLKLLIQGRLSPHSTRGGKAAFNESNPESFGAVSACNEAVWNEITKENGEGWVQLSPYGEFQNDVGLQIFNRVQAEKVVKAFNEGPRRTLADKLLGLPIFVGHPDVPEMADEYPDKRVYGRIKELEARNEGLYGRVKMNKLGREVVDEGIYSSPSPYWALDSADRRPNPKRKVFPNLLYSIGLTNNPVIKGVEPFALNEEIQMNELQKKIAKLLGLDEAANEAAIEAGIAKAMTAMNEIGGVRTKLTEAEGKVTTLTTDLAAANASVSTVKGELTAANGKASVLTTERDTAANALAAERTEREKLILDAAINSGAITQAEKPTIEAELKAAKELTAFNSVATRVMTKASQLFTKSLSQGRTAANGMTKPGWTKFHSAVNEMKAKGKNHNDAWNACKEMDEHKALFAEEQKA